MRSGELRFPFRGRSEISKIDGQRMEKKASRSFTVVELLVVITTIAILALIAYPAYTSVQERAKATKDMNNLRQIGVATQMYMNDNDGALFPPSDSWMNDLHPKYLPTWKVFLSPFDTASTRAPVEDNTNAPVSYGLNTNAKSGSASLSSSNITNPSVFILFAPAQASPAPSPSPPPCTTKTFQGKAGTSAPGVTVLGQGNSQAQSSPGGIAVAGDHSSCQRINACMADLHVENMLWSTFTDNGSGASTDKSAPQRWNPTATPAP
jgi:Tfp pilus assembly protein PilE